MSGVTSRGSRDAPIRRHVRVARRVLATDPARRVLHLSLHVARSSCPPSPDAATGAAARSSRPRFAARASSSSPRSAWRSSRTRASATPTPWVLDGLPGNRQAPEYDVGGTACLNFKGEPCRQYSRARDVIAAVRDNGADLVVHAGDLDYESSRACGAASWTRRCGAPAWISSPSKGNHDADGWDGVQWLWNGDPDGYAAQLRPTLPAGADCRGEYGTAMVCDYRGVTLVLSDVGVDAAGESANARQYEHIDRALRESSNPWKVCVWHMNMENMQVSVQGRLRRLGRVRDLPQSDGAFVVNGHAHTYSRTKEMARFGGKWTGTRKKNWWCRTPGSIACTSRAERTARPASRWSVSGDTGTNRSSGRRRTGPRCTRASCLSGDDACERAPEARKFGALMCDFSDAQPRAEAGWTVTTRPRRTSRAEKRRAYRNPVDSFFLVTEDTGDEASSEASAQRRRTGRCPSPLVSREVTSHARIPIAPPAWTCSLPTTARDRKNGENATGGS